MEALIALALVSSALMGLLWVQWQTLADSATSVRRAQAIHLIDDLAERVRSNPLAQAQLKDYRIEWASQIDVTADCEVNWCDAASLVRWDLHRWKSAISLQLPQGDAAVYALPDDGDGQGDSMLGVMVGWRTRSATQAPPTPRAEESSQPLCPEGWMCHFGHVHL